MNTVSPFTDGSPDALQNPCYIGTHGCDSNAACRPGPGTQFTCECSIGFQGDGQTCYGTAFGSDVWGSGMLGWEGASRFCKPGGWVYVTRVSELNVQFNTVQHIPAAVMLSQSSFARIILYDKLCIRPQLPEPRCTSSSPAPVSHHSVLYLCESIGSRTSMRNHSICPFVTSIFRSGFKIVYSNLISSFFHGMACVEMSVACYTVRCKRHTCLFFAHPSIQMKGDLLVTVGGQFFPVMNGSTGSGQFQAAWCYFM